MKSTVTLIAILVTTATLHAGETKAGNPKPEDSIPKLINNLGSESFELRETAEKNLQSSGKTVIQPLREAVEKSEDPEFNLRARRLLDLLDWETKLATDFKNLSCGDWIKVKDSINKVLITASKHAGSADVVLKISTGQGEAQEMAQIFEQALRGQALSDPVGDKSSESSKEDSSKTELARLHSQLRALRIVLSRDPKRKDAAPMRCGFLPETYALIMQNCAAVFRKHHPEKADGVTRLEHEELKRELEELRQGLLRGP